MDCNGHLIIHIVLFYVMRKNFCIWGYMCFYPLIKIWTEHSFACAHHFIKSHFCNRFWHGDLFLYHIITVQLTTQYRRASSNLIPFVPGFLRTHPGFDRTNSSGGNLGLKDIRAAVRWVKANIAAFGGDPNRVTLLGHDTGAALVNLLFVSPSSKGRYRG